MNAAGLRHRLYAQLFNLLGTRGLSALYAERFAGCGVVFMFHRIIAPGETTLYPRYAVSTTTLDTCLSLIRRAGWAIVSIDEMYDSLRNGSSGQRFACITFDDGYQDNDTLALPILRRHRAPMCLYVATGLIDRTMFYWWGALEHLILNHEMLELELPNDPLGARLLKTVTSREKVEVFQMIDGWCHANELIAEDTLRRLFLRYGVDDRALLERDALTKGQLRQMAKDPLVTVGSHGVSHRRMSLLSDEDLTGELVSSRERLEDLADVPVRHLAYPYGSRDACGRREFGRAASSGYLTAVTTRRGNLFPEHRERLFSLPRREAGLSPSDVRNALYGVSSILRREPRVGD